MNEENINIEYKSLRLIQRKDKGGRNDKGFRTLAETCVAFANAR